LPETSGCINIQFTLDTPLEARMPLAPSLIEASITHLTTLASALAEEMGIAAADSTADQEARACKEILLTVSVLLPKLHAARHMLPTQASSRCAACEDS